MHCGQEFDPVALLDHVISSHFEFFGGPNILPKKRKEHKEEEAEEEMEEEVEDEDYIVCSVCNMRVHINDLDSHIDTHNYESTGSTDYYIPARSEEDLTRIAYTGKGDEQECAVCAVEYTTADVVIRLQCGHYQHEECALKWIAKQKTLAKKPACPTCFYGIFD